MSKNHATDNIYNILNTLKSLEPTPEQTVKAEAKRIYESVEAQGSIIAGVAGVEARLRQQFAESDFSDTSKAIQKSGKSKASADAIAASIGRKNLGQAEMTRRSVAGKKHAHEGVAEGSEHNVGGISHSIIKHPGGKHQVVVKHGDKVAHTSLHNSEEDAKKSLASQVAHSKKMLKVDEQGVAENIGGVGAFAVLQHAKNLHAKNLNKQPQPTAPTKKQSYTPRHDDHEETMGSDDDHEETMGSDDYDDQMEGLEPEDLGTVAEINRLIAKGMHETDAIHAVAKKWGDNPSELASFYYQHNRMHEGTVHKGTYGTSYDPSDEEKRDKPKREIKHGQKGRPRAEKPMDSKSAPKGDIFGRTTGEVPKGKRGTKIKGHGNIDESTGYQKQNFMFESFNFANMMKETDQTVQEMLTELQGDIATFKMTGECSPKLDAFLRVHGHSKKQLADEAKVTPNYEVPAVQRKAAGEPALSLGDVQAHDANRSMHPGMTKLDAPKPANIHDELDELAELAGITKVTDEGNAFTGKLASTAHGDDFELDGKHYTDTSKLDEAMCNECGMYESQCSCTEGNLFTKHLKDTPKGGEFEIDGKHYTDTSNLDEASMKLEDMARLAGIAVEGRDYGDTAFNKPPTYDNTPNEEVQGEDVMLKGGDGEVAGGEKKMTKGGYNFSDNPLAMKESAADLMKEAADFDPMEAMGRRLMKQYEAIKVAK